MTGDRKRLELARQPERLGFKLTAVGAPLGHWARRGDWAKTSPESQEMSGRDALRDLDAVIAELVEFRQRLANAVGSEPTA